MTLLRPWFVIPYRASPLLEIPEDALDVLQSTAEVFGDLSRHKVRHPFRDFLRNFVVRNLPDLTVERPMSEAQYPAGSLKLFVYQVGSWRTDRGLKTLTEVFLISALALAIDRNEKRSWRLQANWVSGCSPARHRESMVHMGTRRRPFSMSEAGSGLRIRRRSSCPWTERVHAAKQPTKSESQRARHQPTSLSHAGLPQVSYFPTNG